MMTETALANEPAIRLGFFVGIFTIMVLWEIAAPRRDRTISRWVRWTNNLGIVVVNTIILRLLTPTAAVGLALVAEEQGWGLFNIAPVPVWVAVPLAIMLMDLVIYLQHIMFHAVPVLWRLHRMHHADLDFDVTTGARFHPIEIILSMAIKLAVVAALGPPAVAILIFEILLNGAAMFNHANLRLPDGLDRALRWVIVTPDMHRVHHSTVPRETNSNFGFNLPWWDQLCGTYQAQPAAGHQGMTIGISQFRTARDLRLDRMLMQPFRGAPRDIPINHPDDADGDGT